MVFFLQIPGCKTQCITDHTCNNVKSLYKLSVRLRVVFSGLLINILDSVIMLKCIKLTVLKNCYDGLNYLSCR